MNIYTKNGDGGTTNLIRTTNISKSDDRIELVGTIDELTSHLGLVRSMIKDQKAARVLEMIQETLIRVMAGVADPYNQEYKISPEETAPLEREIDQMESEFSRPHRFILPGSSRLSAEIDVARTVARRAERVLAAVSIKYGADSGSKMYLNRLADYLYILARFVDAAEEKGSASDETIENPARSGEENALVPELRHGDAGTFVRLNLLLAKYLIDLIEKEAERRGEKVVVAVCGPEGNPIAVHSMDDALLVSFDSAIKKAYSAVAVRMSTLELGKMAQPGGTFYGLDKMEGGKIVIVGGGIPVLAGNMILGGIGVSGGTGQEDHSLAEYALTKFLELGNR